jgi:hypothetical protein
MLFSKFTNYSCKWFIAHSIFHLEIYNGGREVVKIPISVQPFIVYIKETYNFPETSPCQKVLYERLERVIATPEEFYCTDAMQTDDWERPISAYLHAACCPWFPRKDLHEQGLATTSLPRPAFLYSVM